MSFIESEKLSAAASLQAVTAHARIESWVSETFNRITELSEIPPIHKEYLHAECLD
jgi:hypothetical protein